MQDKTGQLPAWLTKEYMQAKLRTYYKDDLLRVLKMSANAASAKGDNYVGVMTRLLVEFESTEGQSQQRTYLIKEACANESPEASIFQEYGVWRREMDMYEFVLPKMSALLREVGIEDKLHADAICVDRAHTTMILEDLTLSQYRNACRKERLDMPHVKLTLEMLAKYHAAAAVLKQRSPELLAQNFACSFFTREFVGYTDVLTGTFKALLRYVKTQPKLEARYYGKLSQLLPNLKEYGARTFDVGPQDFQTLSHGDCWTTNIMFTYAANGQPSSVVPIDFQFSTWTSPATDLHYFFNSSLREEVGAQQTELVQHYYYALQRVLGQFNYQGDLPSLHEFQMQFERRKFLALFVSLISQPIMIYNGKEEPKFQNIYKDHPEAIRFQDSIYESEKVQRIVELMLPIFDAKGLLDDMH